MWDRPSALTPRETSSHGQRNVFSLVVEGVAFLRGQPFMRALYVGVIGAFGAGGLTVGVAQLYVATLRAGAAGYSVVFGVVFTGLAIGMLAGPRVLPTVPRRSVFTHAIGLAGVALLVMSVLRDFVLATAAAFCVGLFAGVSWIIGYTLIGFEVEPGVWTRLLDTQVLPWLADHALEGLPLLPAAAMVDIALAAARSRYPEASVLEVEDLEILRALPLEPGRTRELRVRLSEERRLEIASRSRLADDPCNVVY